MTGPIVMFMIAAILACAIPAERALASYWRHHGAELTIAMPIGEAIPFAPPSPALDALIHKAEDAIDDVEADALIRGTVATARTYERAARHRRAR